MRFTVFGGNGFIGSHLTAALKRTHADVVVPARDAIPEGPLGNVIYCIGMTSDFRSKPFQTAEAHVGLLAKILTSTSFSSFLYLSSTRVYKGLQDAHEDTALQIRPMDPDDLYNATKIAGESLCLSCGHPNMRVARLSNVIGAGDTSRNFIRDLVLEALSSGDVTIRTAAESAKDYIHIDDVTKLLINIAQDGRQKIYNVASGINTTNSQIADALRDICGTKVVFADGGKPIVFPKISSDRIAQEFSFSPVSFLHSLTDVMNHERKTLCLQK